MSTKTRIKNAVIKLFSNQTADTFTGNLTGDVTGRLIGNGANVINFAGTDPSTEVNGSMITTISTWVEHTAAGACAIKILASSTATSGDYATMRIRGRASAVSSGGTEGINVSASTNIANYGDLCAGYFAAQPMAVTNNSASNIITAIHAVVDRTGISSGRTWVSWIDTHQETKSDAGDYLMRLSHNGTVANDGVFTIYNGGRMPYLFNFEDLAGCLAASESGTLTKTHAIAINTPDGVRYIQAGTIA
jgi:hypothetical protein